MKSIVLRSKKKILASRHGLFAARTAEGIDFDELVEYDYQSDAKKIDWNSYARTGKLYQKRFISEHSRHILIAPILTGSLHFGYDRLLFEKVVEAVSLLSFSALLAKDLVHLAPIVEESVQLTRLTNFVEAEKELERLANTKIVGKGFKCDLNRLYPHPKSLLIFIGDFLYTPDLKLLAAKHDVVCILFRQTLLPFLEPVETTDNVTMKKKGSLFDTKGIAHYTRRREALHSELFEAWRRDRVDYVVIEEEPIFEKLRLFFGRR